MISNNKAENKRGGARAGAGRPTIDQRNITISFRCSQKEKDLIFKLKDKKSMTNFILDLIVEKTC